MGKSKTTLKVGDNLPARGRSNKTIILEALRDASLIGLTPKSTKDACEKAFFTVIATAATNAEDPNCGMCLKLLTDKGWASLKPSNETVTFEFDHKADVHVQAAQIVKAISTGDLAPDVGGAIITSIRSMMGIEADTVIKNRIADIEKSLGLNIE
tara:strand:+ start:425 stop:889 length:465 start_codon:yes stop_codon:yes gene_type:complete